MIQKLRSMDWSFFCNTRSNIKNDEQSMCEVNPGLSENLVSHTHWNVPQAVIHKMFLPGCKRSMLRKKEHDFLGKTSVFLTLPSLL